MSDGSGTAIKSVLSVRYHTILCRLNPCCPLKKEAAMWAAHRSPVKTCNIETMARSFSQPVFWIRISLNVDPDPDPVFYLNADLDPDPDSGCWTLKTEMNRKF